MFPVLVCLDEEKSGNPDFRECRGVSRKKRPRPDLNSHLCKIGTRTQACMPTLDLLFGRSSILVSNLEGGFDNPNLWEVFASDEI
jgi:hypothetical protein